MGGPGGLLGVLRGCLSSFLLIFVVAGCFHQFFFCFLLNFPSVLAFFFDVFVFFSFLLCLVDLGVFLRVLAFLLCFLAIVIAWGERSERAKRASEALWCLLWVSRAHPCFRWCPLAFSCVASFARPWFACCLFFVLLYIASHVLTALKRFRSYCCMLPLL